MKQESYTVVIRKEHCDGRVFADVENCPLCAAIREQLPQFNLKHVGGSSITANGKFDYQFTPLFSSIEINEILEGKRDSLTITIFEPGMSLIEPAPIAPPEKELQEKIEPTFDPVIDKPFPANNKPKTIIKYVSVPATIKQSQVLN